MAARVLAETGTLAGALGWAYARRSASRSSTWASTTWSTCSPVLALTLAVRRLERPRVSARIAAVGGVDRRRSDSGLRRARERRSLTGDGGRDREGARRPAAGLGARSSVSCRGRGEEMPRVHMTRGRALAFGLFVLSASRSSTSSCRSHRPRTTWDRLDQGDPTWLASRRSRGALVRRLRGALPHRLRPRGVADRLAGELPDHDGRVRRDPPVRGRRQRRGRADRVGPAPLRDGRAAWSPAGWSPSSMLLYSVYMVALVIVGVLLRTGLLHGGGGFAITVVPAIFGAVSILGDAGRSRSSRRTSSADSSAWAQGGRRRRQARRQGGHRAGARRVGRPHGDRDDPRAARSASLGALAWWGFDIAVLWAAFHAFGTAAAVRRDRDGLLRRHAGQRAARCPGGSAGSTAA